MENGENSGSGNRYIAIEIRRLNAMIRRRISGALAKAGLDGFTDMQRWVTAYLHRMQEQGKEVYQKDLERALFVPRSTLANCLKQMELKGVIERRQGEKDSRLKRIMLTEEISSKLNTAFFTAAHQVDESITNYISSEDLQIFMRVAHQMEKNLSPEGTEGNSCEKTETEGDRRE